MKLNYKHRGQGPPLVILHGLYGASDNWMSFAAKMSDTFSVFLPDLRNHGDSPHNNTFDYEVLANDVKEFIEQQRIVKPVILGHSLGGKTALFFALKYPLIAFSLIIADISPRGYSDTDNPYILKHRQILTSLLEIDFNKVHSIRDAENQLMIKLNDKRLVGFLLKNIRKNPDGTYGLKLNASAIYQNIEKTMTGIPEDSKIELPVMFIKGENSDYIQEKDIIFIQEHFSNSFIQRIPNAGHWLHAEQPEEFLKTVRDFLG